MAAWRKAERVDIRDAVEKPDACVCRERADVFLLGPRLTPRKPA